MSELNRVSFPDSPERENIIELRNVYQTYNGGKTLVVDGFNLLIEDKPGQGQFVVIMGLSGCGKSTILRYVAGLQEPTSGEVLICGEPRSESKRLVSMVFQQYSSLPWKTVAENVMLPLRFQGMRERESREQAMAMIEAVGLLGHENKYAKYPLLSGGQLQRVAIARSLISNPDIILMDEPFGALDTNTRAEMQFLLADIWEGLKCTIVFVTHDMQEAVFMGDDIYIMSANPGFIAHHIPVDLPLHRDRETKRSSRFVDLVSQVEDTLLSMKKR